MNRNRAPSGPPEGRAGISGRVSVPVELFPDLLDVRADLEGGPQLDGHGAHEMVRLEQHQRLAVDLLGGELLHVLGAAGQRLNKVAHLAHVPLQRVRTLLLLLLLLLWTGRWGRQLLLLR